MLGSEPVEIDRGWVLIKVLFVGNGLPLVHYHGHYGVYDDCFLDLLIPGINFIMFDHDQHGWQRVNNDYSVRSKGGT